jgi:hypothetical protein
MKRGGGMHQLIVQQLKSLFDQSTVSNDQMIDCSVLCTRLLCLAKSDGLWLLDLRTNLTHL